MCHNDQSIFPSFFDFFALLNLVYQIIIIYSNNLTLYNIYFYNSIAIYSNSSSSI